MTIMTGVVVICLNNDPNMIMIFLSVHVIQNKHILSNKTLALIYYFHCLNELWKQMIKYQVLMFMSNPTTPFTSHH